MPVATPISERILGSRLLAALASPHGVDRYLEQVNPMWAAHEVRARVIQTRAEVREGNPVTTLTLQPTRTWRGHRAGQHVSVGVDLAGSRRATRVFTIAGTESRPGDPIEITVGATPRTPTRRSVSTFLATQARPGQVLHLGQAEGDFVLPDHVPEEILLISGGTGITPVMAMLRALQRRTHRGRVTFVHFAHTRERQIYGAELAETARTGHGVDLHLLYPGEGDPYLSPALLERLVPGYRDVPTWVCGPPALITAAEAAYQGGAAPQVEYFTPPVLATPGTAEGRVAFARTGTEAANTGDTLLAQAEAAGLTPPSGCRMGICFSCVARKSEGTVRNVLTGETSATPEEDIRICVSTPEGDCSVDL